MSQLFTSGGPTAIPSHQETCISLLSSYISGQTEAARTINPQSPERQPQSQKANQNEHMDHSSVQFSSVAQSSPTLCNPMNCSTPASLSITSSQSLPKLMSIESVMPSNHLILYCPLLLRPQSFSPSGSFQMSQLFASGDQSIVVSASTSVLPMNTQD